MVTEMNGKYNDALTPEQNLLCEHLRSMKMSKMAETLESQYMNPNSDLRPFDERVTEVIESEWQFRYNKKLNRFLKKAHLKYPMADFDKTLYDPTRMLDTTTIERLQTLSWIDEKRNLLISGSSGAGKTYLGNAFCVAACRQFHTVYYIRANRLIQDLERARLQENYIDYLDQLTSYDLLVIDDFGLMTLDLDKCRDLFEVIEGRDSFRSTMVISQIPFNDWYDLFSEKTYADACIRRLQNKAYRLEMNGRDMSQPT